MSSQEEIYGLLTHHPEDGDPEALELAKTDCMAAVKEICRSKTPVAMGITLLLIVGLGVLVTGIYFVASSNNTTRDQIYAYNGQIRQYNSGGNMTFGASNFQVLLETATVNETYATLQRIKEEHYIPEDLLGIYGINAYTRTTFMFQGELFHGCEFPKPPYHDQYGPIYNLKFKVNYKGKETSFITGDVPIWEVVYEQLSQQNLAFKASECIENGGYYNGTTFTCAHFFKITDVCFPIILNSDNTFSVTEPKSCKYPFDTPALYEIWSYQNNTAISFPNTTLTLVSADDPYILLEMQTQGSQSYSFIKDQILDLALGLIAAASIALVISLTLWIVLIILQQRAWAAGKAPQEIDPFTWKSQSWIYFLMSFFCFAVGLGLGIPLIGHESWQPTYSWQGFWGVIVISTFLPVAVMLLFQSMSSVSKHPNKILRMLAFLMCSMFCIGLFFFCFFYMVKPGVKEGIKPDQLDPFSRFTGLFLSLVMIPFGIVNFFIFIRMARGERDIYNKTDEEPLSTLVEEDRKPLIEDSNNEKVLFGETLLTSGYLTLFGVGIVFPVFFMATNMLPPIWNIPFNNYIFMVSPFSLWKSFIEAIEGCPLYGCSDGDSQPFAFKFYGDVIGFYSFIFGIIFLSFLLKIKPLRRIAHTRIFPFQTIGETVMMLIVLGFTCWWFWFWRYGYGRINDVEQKKYTYLESWARATGHLANLLFVYVFFPVTRNSMWEYLYGISFERSLWYHRWMGFFAFVVTTVHLLLWLIKWGIDSTLLYNIWTPTNKPHYDNFTPPMMELVWVGMVIMVSLSYERFRRKNYELFYYVHHFFIVIIVTSLIHSWALWYFFGGPLALWFTDRLIRFTRGTHQMRIVSMKNIADEHVRLEIEPLNQKYLYRAGQYSWVNVPAISSLEWHPFSISSSPNQHTITFHIKEMGVNSWTQKLVKLSTLKKNPQNLVINIDGPYGHPPELQDYDAVILIAGGVGVTPTHSILVDLHQRAVYKREKVPAVYFYWTVRDPQILMMFEPTFSAISLNNPNDKFNVELFATAKDSKTKISLPHSKSRPDVAAEMAQIKQLHGSSVLVFVCGPKLMVDDARALSFSYKFHFHEETFEF